VKRRCLAQVTRKTKCNGAFYEYVFLIDILLDYKCIGSCQ